MNNLCDSGTASKTLFLTEKPTLFTLFRQFLDDINVWTRDTNPRWAAD